MLIAHFSFRRPWHAMREAERSLNMGTPFIGRGASRIGNPDIRIGRCRRITDQIHISGFATTYRTFVTERPP